MFDHDFESVHGQLDNACRLPRFDRGSGQVLEYISDTWGRYVQVFCLSSSGTISGIISTSSSSCILEFHFSWRPQCLVPHMLASRIGYLQSMYPIARPYYYFSWPSLLNSFPCLQFYSINSFSSFDSHHNSLTISQIQMAISIPPSNPNCSAISCVPYKHNYRQVNRLL